MDLHSLLSSAREPMFVLSDRGKLLFANQALEGLVGIGSLKADDRHRLESDFLSLPIDLPVGQVRASRRLWGEGADAQWVQITFVPLRGSDGALSYLGHVSLDLQRTGVPDAIDSAAEERLVRLREEQRGRYGIDIIPARSDGMKRVLRQLKLASSCDLPVSIIGETSTGKSTLARIIHFESGRRDRGLVFLEPRALPPEQQREQLLGTKHISLEKPSVTVGGVAGILNDPVGGTLVIAGIASLTAELQEHLARHLQSEANPWRLIVTERLPLDQLVARGEVDSSLYYLLSDLVIELPPLRLRPDEIPDLCQLIIERAAREAVVGKGLDDEAMAALRRYTWPGNLAELEAVVKATLTRTVKPMAGVRDLPKRILQSEQDEPRAAAPTLPLPSLDTVLERVEQRMIAIALRKHRGNKAKAAQELGISRPRLLRRQPPASFPEAP